MADARKSLRDDIALASPVDPERMTANTQRTIPSFHA